MSKILAVDDDPALLTIIETAFLAYGEFVVKTATSGHEALLELEQFAPDLIISDLIMPGLDGERLIERLRRPGPYCSIPIILLTGTPDIASALQLEGIEIVSKPFDPEALVSKVRQRLASQSS